MSKNANKAGTKSIRTFLGDRPAAFPAVDVEFKAPSGEQLTIPQVVFIYRTRDEFAAWVDEREQAAMAGAKAMSAEVTHAQMYAQADKHTAQTLLQFVASWGLDDMALDLDSVTELINEAPAAFAALYARYTAAARDGRLGNF